MKRRLEIDALRGLMLVWMTLTHLPTALTPWVNQPFGYISSSEGFIFLSALFTGRIYFRLLDRDGLESMNRRFFARTARLYGYHVLLLLFAFFVVARIAMYGHTPALYNLLHFYFSAGAARAMIASLLLIYRPPLLDIIPLYIIFLVLSPFILLLATRTRIGWNYILGASFVLWMAAQLGLRQAAYGFISRHFGMPIPLEEMGAFNLWAWQFMWIVGMWCGVRWANSDLPAEKWAERAWRPALVIAVACLAIRYSEIHGFDLGRLAPLFDKWHFGVVRIFDFAAVAALAIRFQTWLKPLAIRPLVLLGQSSLHVFCTHFVFCFAGLALMGQADHVTGWPQYALLGVTFSALLGVASISSKHEVSVPAQPGALTPAPALSRPTGGRRSRAA
jgi:hypothetical protein